MKNLIWGSMIETIQCFYHLITNIFRISHISLLSATSYCTPALDAWSQGWTAREPRGERTRTVFLSPRKYMRYALCWTLCRGFRISGRYLGFSKIPGSLLFKWLFDESVELGERGLDLNLNLGGPSFFGIFYITPRVLFSYWKLHLHSLVVTVEWRQRAL